MDKKVEILCPIHGEFWQTPYVHSKGACCPKCALVSRSNKRRDNKDTFIRKAKEVHGNTYNYEKVEYVNSHTLVEIKCLLHGYFSQKPIYHTFNKSGCPKCTNLLPFSPDRTVEFIKDANNVHKGKYSYPNLALHKVADKIVINCPLHGDFQQAAFLHLKGRGCKKCSGRSISDTHSFVLKAKKVHGDKYDYSKVEYHKSWEQIIIGCRLHGTFTKTPNNHLCGQGCPSCTPQEGGCFNPSKPAKLYYLSVGQQAYKIGITNRTVQERFNTKELQIIKVIKVWDYVSGAEALAQEQKILKEFSYAKYSGVNLLESGNTELFTHDILGLDTDW